MDSDESYHSESELYYENEEDKENNAEETQPSFTRFFLNSFSYLLKIEFRNK